MRSRAVLFLPVILSFVPAQAEQRHVLLEHPPARPAGSWTALGLCVHSSLPAGKQDGRDEEQICSL